MTEIPPWWAELTASPHTARLGIGWRPPSTWADDPEEEKSLFGTMRTAFDQALDDRIREGKVLVGIGPEVVVRASHVEVPVHWYLDPADPSRLWCALGSFYYAWLWVPVEPEPEALAEVLSHSHPKPSLTDVDMPGFTRGFLGHVSELHSNSAAAFNGRDLDRYFTGVRYAEPCYWASSLTNDPFVDDSQASSNAVIAGGWNSNAQAQRLGRIPSMTWRMLHSRAYLSFEIHFQEQVFFSVRYRPSPASHRPVVERLNEEWDFDFPTDLPLDVIGALNGFPVQSERELAPLMDPDEEPIVLCIYAGLWCGDVRRTRRLAEYAAHPSREVRMVLARVANWYGYPWLAGELALAERDPELREACEGLTVSGGKPDRFNAFNDYFGGDPIMVDGAGRPVETWSDDDGYEDEEEDEKDEEVDEDEESEA